MEHNNLAIRREVVKQARQVIVKAGTRLLTSQEAIAELVEGIDALRRHGSRVLLVSSGAVGMGMRILGLKKRPKELAQVQALAAIGQSRLMSIYDEECGRRNFKTAQLLLTADDLRSRKRYLNVMNCINALWENGVLPIVNENDPVSVDELKFGDNDTLAAVVAVNVEADLLVLLSDIDGLYTQDPHKFPSARLLSQVEELTPEIFALAGEKGSPLGTGGMRTKLCAAEISTNAGIDMIIANGADPLALYNIADGKAFGTKFVGKRRR